MASAARNADIWANGLLGSTGAGGEAGDEVRVVGGGGVVGVEVGIGTDADLVPPEPPPQAENSAAAPKPPALKKVRLKN